MIAENAALRNQVKITSISSQSSEPVTSWHLSIVLPSIRACSLYITSQNSAGSQELGLAEGDIAVIAMVC